MGRAVRDVKGLLLSGGMDSSALAYAEKPDCLLCIDYGQLAALSETAAASLVAEAVGKTLHRLRLDARDLGSGVMAGQSPSEGQPCAEWWPFRNQFVLTVAAMWGFRRGVDNWLIGTVAGDGESHADGRSDFVQAISGLTAMQEGRVAIHAPALQMTTVELIRSSSIPIELLVATHSCHVSNLACGQCRGCFKREGVLVELGLVQA